VGGAEGEGEEEAEEGVVKMILLFVFLLLYNICITGNSAFTPHLPRSNVTIQQLLTGTEHYWNGIIICLPESQDSCGSGGVLFTATRAQMASPHGYRQPSVLGSIWSLPGAYKRIHIRICAALIKLFRQGILHGPCIGIHIASAAMHSA
jgi:hypothetical protein